MFTIAKKSVRYTAEFKRQMVDLVRSGRTAASLAKEFGPSAWTVADFLPPEAIKSVVVFSGEAEFKTEIPQGVFTSSGLVEYLRDQTEEVISLNRVHFCVGRLETARLAISRETDVEHVRSLEHRRSGLR